MLAKFIQAQLFKEFATHDGHDLTVGSGEIIDQMIVLCTTCGIVIFEFNEITVLNKISERDSVPTINDFMGHLGFKPIMKEIEDKKSQSYTRLKHEEAEDGSGLRGGIPFEWRSYYYNDQKFLVEKCCAPHNIYYKLSHVNCGNCLLRTIEIGEYDTWDTTDWSNIPNLIIDSIQNYLDK